MTASAARLRFTSRRTPMRKIVAACVFLCGCLAASAAPLNGLYFGLDNMRGFAEVYWWFLNDGRVLHGLPTSGLTPADFENACKTHPDSCGSYSLAGDKLTIQYRGGRNENWTYKPLNGGFQMNYIILSEVKKYPSGTRLNGTWSRPFSAGAGTAGSPIVITSPTFLSFHPDGTFAEKNVTGVDAKSGFNSSSSQSGGAYTIQDY